MTESAAEECTSKDLEENESEEHETETGDDDDENDADDEGDGNEDDPVVSESGLDSTAHKSIKRSQARRHLTQWHKQQTKTLKEIENRSRPTTQIQTRFAFNRLCLYICIRFLNQIAHNIQMIAKSCMMKRSVSAFVLGFNRCS